MIKAVIGDPPKALILGLSAMNLSRLEADDPIVIFGEEVGVRFDIMIQHGGSEARNIPEVIKQRARNVCVLGLKGDVFATLKDKPGDAIVTIRNVANGVDIILVSGDDEAKIRKMMSGLIGPNTKVEIGVQ